MRVDAKSLHAVHRSRVSGILDLPEFNVAVFAFLLNYPWEFLQVPFFADMATAPHWDAVRFCTRATLGQIIGFIAAGIAITVAFEWFATEVWDRWSYGEAMPTIPLLRTGLLPLLQWTILPPIIVWFVRRQIT